jgi:predicted MFS family arabinose efflux permease
MRDRPSDVGLGRYGARAGEEPSRPAGNPVGTALVGLRLGLRSRAFWLIGSSFFICGASTNGLIGTHLIPASIDHGIAEVTAAGLLAAVGVFDVVGTTLSGWLTDRFDARWLLFWYYGLRGLSLLLLPFVLGSSFFGLILFVVFYGLDWVATVPPTISLTRASFGSFGPIVYGWVFACHQLGASAAAFGAGAVRTWLGDYQLAFVSAGLMCLVACGLVLRVDRGGREREPARAPAMEPAAG